MYIYHLIAFDFLSFYRSMYVKEIYFGIFDFNGASH